MAQRLGAFFSSTPTQILLPTLPSIDLLKQLHGTTNLLNIFVIEKLTLHTLLNPNPPEGKPGDKWCGPVSARSECRNFGVE